MDSRYIIFYSWQSDLPSDTNSSLLRHVLREISTQIESELVNTTIINDESSRNTLGSHDIVRTIFSKIEECDIFFCDITTINTGSELRKTPNPNVLIELGFAIAQVGWDRIILVFNEAHGSFPSDLPFDISKHKTTLYNTSKNIDYKQKIIEDLKLSIQDIIMKNPPKPNEIKLSPEQIKRQRDLVVLTNVLNTIHIPTLDDFLDNFPSRIPSKIFYFREFLDLVVSSHSFHIYDQDLRDKILVLKNNLTISLSYGHHFEPDGKTSYYRFHKHTHNTKASSDFTYLENLRNTIDSNLHDLLSYVRSNYTEVDTSITSKNAYESYINDIQ